MAYYGFGSFLRYIQEIMDNVAQPIPQEIFIYAIGILVALLSLFVAIGGYYFKGDRETTRATLAKTVEILNRLVTNDAVKEQRLNYIDEKLEHLDKKVHLVNYEQPARRT